MHIFLHVTGYAKQYSNLHRNSDNVESAADEIMNENTKINIFGFTIGLINNGDKHNNN